MIDLCCAYTKSGIAEHTRGTKCQAQKKIIKLCKCQNCKLLLGKKKV